MNETELYAFGDTFAVMCIKITNYKNQTAVNSVVEAVTIEILLALIENKCPTVPLQFYELFNLHPGSYVHV
ncbi:hypothetical protein T10_11270 [Trichinella papuae]|uniref:Uncharacterized protein n=1 Tax=Trichinella papuae TaxID=268474 RepID=A0A0V1MLF8_9BILA|nr:hypothetical protein T10_11270 [Trichinella papuae]